VVDYASLCGAAQTAGSYVQPVGIFNSSVTGGANALYYFGPNPSATNVRD
jgi:hypothetical protein